MKIPDISIARLSVYTRALGELLGQEIRTISSRQLAERIGVTPDKVRKDLSYFGQFGHRGVGYDVETLHNSITRILGLNRPWNIAICGAGNLSRALFTYQGFLRQGFKIVAVFDNHPKKLGTRWGRIRIADSREIYSTLKKKKIEIVIIAVPAPAAQAVTDEFVRAGVKAILNFAPVKLSVPTSVKLRDIDLSTEIVNLTHFLSSPKGSGLHI